ncbi:MAG: hypothetical protein RIQ33_39, partial [Bacteroidota bacterium]
MKKKINSCYCFFFLCTLLHIGFSNSGLCKNENASDNYKLQAIINNAIKNNIDAVFPKGIYKITKPLVIPNSINIIANANCSITQLTENTPILVANSVSNVSIRNLILIGVGNYTSLKKRAYSKHEIGIDFTNCTKIIIENSKFINFSYSAISISGGSNIKIQGNYIEGTHLKGTKLNKMDNYQFGICLTVTPIANKLTDIQISNNEICYTNQGIITSQGKTGLTSKISISNNFIHHIIGQHGLYISTSNTTIENNKVEWAGLEGIKIQAAHCNLENIIIKKNNVKNCVNSQAFNITEINNGLNKITNVKLIDCSAYNCARGINLSGRLDNILIKNIIIDSTSKQYGLCIQTEMANNILFDSIKIKRTKQAPIFIVSKQNQKIEFKNININSKISP